MLPAYKTHPWVLPLRGRSKQRSNLFPTDLSFTSVTYLSKLRRMNELDAWLQLEIHRVCASTLHT
ncbi:hypothetical protein AL485_25045 [Serratia liquefaciens]|nr:hypothetical protein AL485_25045 [Serratia liquefaciens]HCR64139.1 hypothetical protein [Serratia liquefaciens]